jgi:hypothetical protein
VRGVDGVNTAAVTPNATGATTIEEELGAERF